jgi:hypothetical protein
MERKIRKGRRWREDERKIRKGRRLGEMRERVGKQKMERR